MIMRFIALLFVVLSSICISEAALLGGSPIGFSGKDANYVLQGQADIFIVDEQGNKSGFINGRTIEEIPGVSPNIPMGGSTKNRKEIYMPDRKDLTVVIVGNTTESYTLMVAGGNYYLKIEGVETEKGQIDEIKSRENSVEINFDDDIEGDYNIMMNFYEYENGGIYYPAKKSIGDIQKYLIDWAKVNERKGEGVDLSIQEDNDDEENKYDIVFYDEKFGIPETVTAETPESEHLTQENSEPKSNAEGVPKSESILSEASDSDSKALEKYIFIGLISLSYIFFILLSIVFYKNKISRKKYLIVSGLLLVILLFCIHSYFHMNESTNGDNSGYENKVGKTLQTDLNSKDNNDTVPTEVEIKETACAETKEPGTEFDGKGPYEIKDNAVYKKDYIGTTLNYDLIATDIDAKSFRIISSGYTRDANNIYYWGRKVEHADLCSFEVSPFLNASKMSEGFARDINYVYYSGKILKKVDVKTFERQGSFYLKDKNHVYNRYGDVIKGIDAQTFVYDNISYFSYDKNGVYPYQDIHIKGADGKTFKKVGGYIYKDKKNVYFRSLIIKGADPETFESLSYEYYKDKNHIYGRGGNILEGADANTYTSHGKFYYDKNGVYPKEGFFIPGADIESFVDLRDGYYKDKNNAYFSTKYYQGSERIYIFNTIEDIDTNSFEKVSKYGYAKDENNVYYKGLLISNAHVDSFITLGGMRNAKDNNNVYYQGKVILDADPTTYKYLGGKHSVDSNNVYFNGEVIENSNPSLCNDWKECNTNYPKK